MLASPVDRQDTDAILSYYQSDDADRFQPNDALPEPCQPRAGTAPPVTSSPATGALRRTSKGGTDRRRLAVVDMGAQRPEKSTGRETRTSVSGGGPPSSLRTRLEVQLRGLALVAPPDASPQTYSALTPPRTAPVQPSIAISTTNHARSSSDASEVFSNSVGHVPRQSSREVAIVGTTSFPASVPQQPSNTPPAADSLRPPVFQISQSRSPSPGSSEISDSGCSTNRGRRRRDALAPGVSPVKELMEFATPVRTPNIGESKHISDRVAGPIVINLFPHSPSPSPAFSSPHSSTQDLMSPRTNSSSPLTPSTALTSPTTTPSPYLHYQPGLHATAGPLPPPPQAVFTIDPKVPPPPRPPRHSPIRRKGDLDAIKQVLQLPPHVTAALKSKSSSSSSTKRDTVPTSPQKMTTTPPTTPPSLAAPSADSPPSSHESFGSDHRPHHVREGAFPPSRLCTSDSETSTSPREEFSMLLPRLESMDDLVASVGLAIDDMGIMSSSDVPPPTVVEPPRGHEGPSGRKGLEIRRPDHLQPSLGQSHSPERSHVDLLPSLHSDEGATHGWVDPDKAPIGLEETVPPVPAKSDLSHLDTKSLKSALNIKRFSSLPRTPSLMSLNRPVGNKRSSGTPSPSVAHFASQPKPPVRRIKSAHPRAMYFADVTVKRTALERSMGYAYKINELYNYDCGLADWITETKFKALHPHSSTKRPTVNSSRGPRAPSTSSPSLAPRHISQSSTDSGVTFPRRADAYSATDLAPRAAGDSSPPNAPPPLPYPALAAAPRPSRASTMIATSSTSSSRSIVLPSSVTRSPGSFLASLGRRASIKREKPLTPPSPVKTLSRSPPRSGNEQPSLRPTNLQPVGPSVPGGPRAPPNRVQRSQTTIVPPQNPTSGASHQRSSTMTRRPSLFDGRVQQHESISEVEFNRQVDKLGALLPRADRNVLAVYLRHAGQDILAIGQYLEDEKNGTFRYE